MSKTRHPLESKTVKSVIELYHSFYSLNYVYVDIVEGNLQTLLVQVEALGEKADQTAAQAKRSGDRRRTICCRPSRTAAESPVPRGNFCKNWGDFGGTWAMVPA